MGKVGGKDVTPDIVSSDDKVVKVGRILRKFGREQSFEIATVGAGFASLSCQAGGALGSRFGCATPAEAVQSHRIFAAALASQKQGETVSLCWEDT